MTGAPWAVSVVIPARDEAATVAAAVRSVIRSARAAGRPFDITVVADGCVDATAGAAAQAVSGHGRVIEVVAGTVGSARRAGTTRSLAALAADGHAPEETWLLATDADSTVPSAWIRTHLDLADAGAHGVAGLVVVDSFADHPPSVEQAFRRRYEVGVSGEHPHVHGTNLGVRADAYARAGGWRDLRTAEDHDLWNRLTELAVPLCSTVDAPVRTSGRAAGRAPDGFASLLRSLATAGGSRELAG
ncbi:glycosyltransferase [Aquihabitans daechungensis]|uniref:glycosyltransferase n=1 Tax=Aquihabitans daechungensis TaxID=1052257 RepID=UPI003B9F89FE